MFWTATQNWGQQAIAFVVFALLARLLDPEAFGLVALAAVYVALLQLFVDQGFSDAIVQRKELAPGHLDTAFWSSVGLAAVLAGASALAAPWIARAFGEEELGPVIRWLSASFLLAGLGGTHQAVLRRELRFRPIAVVTLVAAAGGGAIGVAMAVSGRGVWSLVGQQLGNACCLAVGFRIASGWRPGRRVSWRRFRDLFGFGASVLGTNVVSHVARRSDDFFVGVFLGPVALGFYSVGYRVLRILTRLLTQTVNAVAFPAFSRLQEDRERLRRGFYRVTRLNGLVAFPAFAGVAAVAPDLVPVLFGERWSASVPVMRVLCLVGVLHSVSFFQSAVIAACGKPSWRFGLMLLNATGNVVAFAIAVRFGITAVAIAYAIRVYAFWPLQLYAVHRLLPFRMRDYFGVQAPALAGAAALFGACFLIRGLLAGAAPPLALAAQVATGAVVYLLAIRVLAPGQVTEAREMIASLRGDSGS